MSVALSVVLPTYNQAALLPRALEAIAAQGGASFELVLVDDGSTDETPQVIADFAKRHSFVRALRNEENRGQKASMRRGVEAAQGDYIYMAADDDRVLPGFFEAAMELALAHPEAGLVFGRVVIVDSDFREESDFGASRWSEPLYASPERFRKEYLEVEGAGTCLAGATIYRRGPFDELMEWNIDALRGSADNFRIRAIGLEHGVGYIPLRCMEWTRRAGTISQSIIDDPRAQLDIMTCMVALMRAPTFRDRFPADHVERWEAAFRALMIERELFKFQAKANASWESLLASVHPEGRTAPIWIRALGAVFKLQRLLGSKAIARALRRYEGKVPDSLRQRIA